MGDESTLYDRLGGGEAIEAVVYAFYERVLADDQLIHYFEGVDLEQLRTHQRTFISAVTDGPAEYDGREMREAHANLDLTAADFAAVAGHLDAVLREFDVADADRNALLERVADLEADIVANGEVREAR